MSKTSRDTTAFQSVLAGGMAGGVESVITVSVLSPIQGTTLGLTTRSTQQNISRPNSNSPPKRSYGHLPFGSC